MTTREYNQAVEDFADGIFRFALKHVKNEMTAKDIVQEAFTRVWVRRESIHVKAVKTYLFKTTYTVLVDWIKKEQINTGLDGQEYLASAHTNGSPDLNEVLEEALNRLPEIQKSVVLLRDYEGYSYEEIGSIVNLTESQVKVYIFRARQALKHYLVQIDYVI